MIRGCLRRKLFRRKSRKQFEEMERHRQGFDQFSAECKAERLKEDIAWLKIENDALMRERLRRYIS